MVHLTLCRLLDRLGDAVHMLFELVQILELILNH